MKKRSTNAELAFRIAAVADLLIQGASRSDVHKYCESEYNVSTSQADRYLQSATTELQDQAAEAMRESFALAVARYNRLFAKNYKIQDFRECRNVQQALDKLLNTSAVKPQEEEIKENNIYSIAKLG